MKMARKIKIYALICAFITSLNSIAPTYLLQIVTGTSFLVVYRSAYFSEVFCIPFSCSELQSVARSYNALWVVPAH